MALLHQEVLRTVEGTGESPLRFFLSFRFVSFVFFVLGVLWSGEDSMSAFLTAFNLQLLEVRRLLCLERVRKSLPLTFLIRLSGDRLNRRKYARVFFVHFFYLNVGSTECCELKMSLRVERKRVPSPLSFLVRSLDDRRREPNAGKGT